MTKKISISTTVVSYVVMLSLFVLSITLIKGFATIDRTFELLQTSAFLGILVIGQATVILSGGFDLSVSSILTMSSILVSALLKTEMNTGLAILLTLLICTLVGSINAMGVALLKIPPIIMTIATVSLIEGCLLIITNGTPPSGMTDSLRAFANSRWFFGMANVIVVWLCSSIFAFWFLNKSKYGRYIYAIGINEEASKLSGISVNKIKFMAYCISGFFSGLAGIMLAGYMGSTYLTIGTPYQLSSVASVVMGGIAISGGKGNYLGAISGVLIITILQSVLNVVNIPAAGRELFQGVLIILILLAYGREKIQK